MSFIQSVGTVCDELSRVATVVMAPLIVFELMVEKRLIPGLAIGRLPKGTGESV